MNRTRRTWRNTMNVIAVQNQMCCLKSQKYLTITAIIPALHDATNALPSSVKWAARKYTGATHTATIKRAHSLLIESNDLLGAFSPINHHRRVPHPSFLCLGGDFV